MGFMVLRCWGWLQDEQPTSLPEAVEQPAAEKDGDELLGGCDFGGGS